MALKVDRHNEGLYAETDDQERIKRLWVARESGSVHLRIDALDGAHFLLYLTPLQAMAFSKAFDRCAVAALRGEVE